MNITIKFAPVPDGSRWQVLVEKETTTLYRVDVDHAGLDVDHDPDDVTALREAVSVRALELVAQGNATILGVDDPPASITTWELEGSGHAQEALEYHTRRVTGPAPQ